LHKCGHDDAQRDATDRPAGKLDRLLATVTGEPATETTHGRRRRFAMGIHDRGEDNGEPHLNDEHTDGSGLARDPLQEPDQVRLQLGDECGPAFGRRIAPCGGDLCADHRDGVDEFRRLGNLHVVQ
jgi:hypothetical protein